MVDSVKDAAEAIKRGDNYIEIEVKLGEKLLKIKATGSAAWAVCITAISVAIAGIAVSVGSGGSAAAPAALISTPGMAGTVAILGAPAATVAVGLAVAGGGVGVLKHLMKDYDIQKADDKYILYRKNESIK